MTLVDAYKDFLANAKLLNLCVKLEIEGKVVRIPFIHRSIALMTVGGPLEHTFYMENASKIYPSTPVACWIRHLIGQAAGLKYATVIFCQANGAARTFRPMLEETAKSFLEKYLRLALAPLPQELPDYEKTSLTEDTAEGTPFEEVLLDANKYTVSTSR